MARAGLVWDLSFLGLCVDYAGRLFPRGGHRVAANLEVSGRLLHLL